MDVSLDIVANIKRSGINGNVPIDAEYARLSPSGFIMKFYKFIEVRFNDGSIKDVLNYWGEQGGWHPSYFNSEPHKLSAEIFLKII